jgi:hypothetical protein
MVVKNLWIEFIYFQESLSSKFVLRKLIIFEIPFIYRCSTGRWKKFPNIVGENFNYTAVINQLYELIFDYFEN